MKIPEKIEKTMYVNLCAGKYGCGAIRIHDSDYVSKLDGHEEVRLFAFPLTIDAPEGITMSDITQRLVETLEQQKKGIQAEYHVKLQRIQDKIDNLLALENKPEEA